MALGGPAIQLPKQNIPYKGRGIFVFLLFLVLLICEPLGSSFLLVSILILTLFGLIHFFSKGIINVFVLGVIPLILALVALPEALGGTGVGTFISSIPLIGWFAPATYSALGSFLSLRVLFFILIPIYYWSFFRKYLATAGNPGYRSMWSNAGVAVKQKSSFSFFKLLFSLIFLFLIIGLETQSGILSSLGLTAYGPIAVIVALLILTVVVLFKKSFFGFVLAFVSFILAIAGAAQHFGFGTSLFSNSIMSSLLPGGAVRYLLIAVILLYYMFRKHPSLSQPVSP